MTVSCDPHWTAYVTALLTPVIALLGAIIAAQQWRTARNKLKLELFERRFAIYEGARSFIGSIITSGQAKDEELFKFIVSTREANWLISKEVQMYMEEQLYKPAIDLQCLSSELQGVPVGPARSKNLGRQGELKKAINAQYAELEKVFAPYLQLSH